MSGGVLDPGLVPHRRESLAARWIAFSWTATRSATTSSSSIQVTEAELQEKLSTFLDRVAFAEDEPVVMRDGQPIVAVISMDG